LLADTNTYHYAKGNPLAFADPNGTGPLGFAVGFAVGFGATSAAGPEALPAAIEDGLLLGELVSAFEDALFPNSPSSCPNPYGRKGAPAHQNMVRDRANQLQQEGHEIIAGGRRLPERGLRTPEGRIVYPDISTVDPSGIPYYENIGRSRLNDEPISREQRALDSIERVTGVRPGFTPYNR
jgi:hypothetical protein